MFKGVWNITATNAELDAAVDESLAWLSQRGAPFAFFSLGVDGEAEDLRARLEARGIAPWDLDAPGMAELDALDWNAAERAPVELEIRTVRTDDELEAFGRTFVLRSPELGRAGVDRRDALRRRGRRSLADVRRLHRRQPGRDKHAVPRRRRCGRCSE